TVVLKQRRHEQERDICPAPRPLAPANGEAIDLGHDDAVEPVTHGSRQSLALCACRSCRAREERLQVPLPRHERNVGERFDLAWPCFSNERVEGHECGYFAPRRATIMPFS